MRLPNQALRNQVKVPAIFSHPGVISPGIVIDDLLSQYDVLPTLLEYALSSSHVTEALPGINFGPLLRGNGPLDRKEVVVFDEYGPIRMFRTTKWKYAHRYPYGPHELFDLDQEPEELTNKIEDESLWPVCNVLRARLGPWYVKYADPRFDGVYAAVTGFGQYDLALPGKRDGASFERRDHVEAKGVF